MSGKSTYEPERYEFGEPPGYAFNVNRRDFLKLGGGIFVCLACGGATAQESGRAVGSDREAPPREIGAWLHIAQDGAVTVYTGKVEMGQNIRTSLAQAVADELSLPVTSVVLVMGDTDRTPFDLGTFGSRTTPQMAPQLRKAAAAARELLVSLAAERWGVPAGTLSVSDGAVKHATSNRIAGFGELTRGQRLVKTIADDQPTTPPEKWQQAGRAVPRVNGRELVTGAHRYTSDLKRPGMLYGKVVRPNAIGATLVSCDDSAARQIAGVTVVRDGNFIGVAAPKPWLAAQAAQAVKADWKSAPQPSSAEIFGYLKANLEPGGWRGNSAHVVGSVEQGLEEADIKLQQTYTVAYIAHAPLEPRAAVAEWSGDKLTVWTGTQRPFAVREELAQMFHLPLERVRVIVPDTGSAYGGKHTGECAVEAARLAKAAGRPVKLTWTRAEEFQWAYFRPAGVIEIRSGVRKDGTVLAWQFTNYNSGAAAIRTMYDVPNQRIEFVASRSPLRQGSYRALAATANHFARETHMDELAHAIGMDPLAFRLKNLKDERLRAVFQAAADRFAWQARPPRGRGYGIAGGFEKGGYVAACAEVEMKSPQDEPIIHRVVVAFDCGAVVNPDGLKNQIEGAVIQGLGGALFEAIEFSNGRITNGSMREYRVPRFVDVPPIEVVLLDHKDQPSAGAGETPIVGVAPAIGNAIFKATGERRRSLPLAKTLPSC